MTNRVLTVVVVAALVSVAAPASAQTTQMPTYELSAGYQLLRTGETCVDVNGIESCADGDTFPFGLAIDAVRNWGALGLVGEGGWSYDSTDVTFNGTEESLSRNSFHLAAGVRWTGRGNPRIWPYGQILGGALIDHVGETTISVSDTRTRFMLQPGVGVNFVAGDGWGFVTQVDYRRVFLDEDEDFATGRNDVRVFLGARMILD